MNYRSAVLCDDDSAASMSRKDYHIKQQAHVSNNEALSTNRPTAKAPYISTAVHLTPRTTFSTKSFHGG